ncbi:hypothetical protein L3Q82_014370 [Scortum barcoo]|uniref:Uncharacterized protein n=1 Tax=Scortum barcoo TaxID=214431 RepID=A0ACB8VWR4_9TELE|nr:hypothetical protein L3Q82_014370 [Scortum barcoo]
MVQQKVIHNETYANIRAASTSQEQMRELYSALTSIKAKSAFYQILQEIQPAVCETEDVVKEVMRKHKACLRQRFQYEIEGTDKDPKAAKSLAKIYTELHITQGQSERVNKEHEIWEIEDKERRQTAEGTKINYNDIFKCTPEDTESSGQDRGKVEAIRTVMTKGIAGIGKTISVKKFILDWADGKANQDFDFIFVLPFRELNLVIDDEFSLETLVRDFHPELKNTTLARIFANHKVLFIFDGLDESQLQLNFKTTKRLTDPTKESSVDTLVTNLIREHLLPSAFVWITSRPGAVQRIPREHIYQWTEVRGFNDPQKIEYFRKRVEDKAIAERIITSIKMSRSLYIMCHIPIFCWIAAKVLTHLLLKIDDTQDENIKIPTTLTEMYTYFLCIQMQVAADKYDKQNELDTEEIFKSNKEFILKLGRMSFEHLKDSKIMFTGNDMKNYGIDVYKAGVACGLCTEILKEESVFNSKKLYCFVHLTVQEYFAALFVYHSFASKRIDSQSLKDFLLKGSEEELKLTLEKDPVDLPLDELIEIAITNSTQRKTGELDMFLRFLIGMSLKSTQDMLHGLIQQTEEHSATVEEIRKSLREIDLLDCSPERCLNLVHCLTELNDISQHDTVEKYLKPDNNPETQLSPAQCSVLAYLILIANTPLEEFNLKKYRPSSKGIFRLVPGIRNSRKASLSGNGLSSNKCDKLASAVKSVILNLRELELSGNILGGSLFSVLPVGLGCPKLEKLRLNRNGRIDTICEKLVTAFTSSPCYLRELDLSSSIFTDSEMQILCTGLMSTNCNLKVLGLSYNRLTEEGCKTLASALSSKSSCLTKLDLSYNDLQDSGVMALCDALMSPHCALQTLRLSFCKVTGDGCAALAKALRPDHCSLRELDLSFNHLTDQGVELLTERQSDTGCSLEKLNVDQNEEFWFDLRLLRQYGCDLTLDPNSAGMHIILTEGNTKATYEGQEQPYPDHPDRFDCFQVLCEEGLTGRHYWEAECVSADVGVAYKSMDRAGDCSVDFSLGGNEKSWCWCCKGEFKHNDSLLEFLDCNQSRSTMGVYLDWPAGILSFFEVFPDTLTHLYTVCTTFTEPLHPCFGLDLNGSVYLRKM